MSKETDGYMKAPSTPRICPVINEDFSSARKSIALATSSGVPILPTGVSSLRTSSVSLSNPLFIGVSITPGATAFTVMPDGATSLARAFVSPITAAFDAE